VVARRSRFDAEAERHVLTVPAYDGHVARALSEREYVRAFVREAEALLALPTDPHLSRIIAADGGAEPLPHFVSERVDGVGMDRLLARAQLTIERALAHLLGVLRGLYAMHAAGLAHLGLRPAHVVVRRSEADLHGVPVLCGYGMSGRHVRPGCAYAPYGAPEIWRLSGDADLWSPQQADVYAFGCLAYELLMGERLFDGQSDAACIAEHVSHDGVPHRVGVLMQSAATRPLAEWLTTCLRRRPEDRASVEDLMRTLPSLRPLARMPWPIASAPPGPG
jgi:serine/threonine protein kinase